MKAAIAERYGPPSVIEIRDVETPVPSGDQVLVSVRAASVNRADLDSLYPRWAFLRLIHGLRAPRNHRLGLDVAGVVEAVGPEVTRFRAGDEVFADLYLFGSGAFAEFACAPERAFLPKPPNLSFEAAACLPHSAVLAVQGLRHRGGRTIGPGDRVLIEGASGNVGPFAIQIAKARGAEVTGVCHTDKVDFVRSLGADHVIDYIAGDYTEDGERYDWILAVESRHLITRYRRVLRPGGTYVALGASSTWLFLSFLAGPVTSRATGKSIGLCLWWKPFHAPDVEALTELIAEGRLQVAIDRTYPLESTAEAVRRVDDGLARGKVVITV